MLGEGLDPVTIERAATLAGFPAPPLAMVDEVSLTLPRKINAEASAATEASGGAFVDGDAMSVLDTMVDTLDRLGKAAGAGFYDYPDGGKKHLWPGLYEHFVVAGAEIPLTNMQERMLFIMSLETVRCLAEGVLRTVPDANIGSIMGIGFPPLYGGALQYSTATPASTSPDSIAPHPTWA